MVGIFSSKSLGRLDNSVDMSLLPACNELSAVNISVNIVESKTYTVLSPLFSQGISKKQSIRKNKLAKSVLSKESNTNNAFISLIIYLLKIILHCI